MNIIIKTEILRATNTEGTRIKATANRFTAIIPFEPDSNGYQLTHFRAVQALVKNHSLDWDISNMGFGYDHKGCYFTFNNSIIQGA
jgi:hypothetical protein